ncbi:MAG: relaxase domain-containing protein [Cutibacterium avidum]|nr:relaxase domain-containing protein [Cutibacterium avidum]
MTRTFGVSWEAREMGRDRNPSWAITHVPADLVAEFSTRSRHINEATDALIADYVTQHGTRPSPATIMKLRAQATLATRPDKRIRSLAELTVEWRTRASRLLGSDATEWARSVTGVGTVAVVAS